MTSVRIRGLLQRLQRFPKPTAEVDENALPETDLTSKRTRKNFWMVGRSIFFHFAGGKRPSFRGLVLLVSGRTAGIYTEKGPARQREKIDPKRSRR